MRINVVVVAVLLVSAVLAQADEDVNVVNVNLGKVETYADPEAGMDGQQTASIEEQQRYYGMRRTACLVLSRHHTNTLKDEIEGIIQAMPVEQQQKFINKMYATAVEQCEQVIVPDEVQQLYVENPSFDASALFHVFSTVSYTAISKESFKLTKSQEQIVEYIRNFDQEMEVKREEQKAEEEKLMGDEKYDIKIFGISAKDIGSGAKLIYVVIFAGIVGGLLWYGLRELSKTEKKTKKKSSKREAAAAGSPRSASPTSPEKKKE